MLLAIYTLTGQVQSLFIVVMMKNKNWKKNPKNKKEIDI